MISVSDAAAQQIRGILATPEVPDGQAVRILREADGEFSLTLDSFQEGDHRVEAGGVTVLLVAPELLDALEDAVLDVEVTSDGTVFFIGFVEEHDHDHDHPHP